MVSLNFNALYPAMFQCFYAITKTFFFILKIVVFCSFAVKILVKFSNGPCTL